MHCFIISTTNAIINNTEII